MLKALLEAWTVANDRPPASLSTAVHDTHNTTFWMELQLTPYFFNSCFSVRVVKRNKASLKKNKITVTFCAHTISGNSA